MAIAKPGDDGHRRCAGCEDLTRFDVVRTVRSGDFVHQELSGAGSAHAGRVAERASGRV